MPFDIDIKKRITGVALAGGQARRMGGVDKGLLKLNNKAMIEYVLDALKSQVNYVVINANRNHDIYEKYGYPIVSDELEGFCGPLAGFASAMKVIDTEFMLTVPCDSPFVPEDLVVRLYSKLQGQNADISVAHSGDRLQPVFSLIKKELNDSVSDYLSKGGRKIDRWFEQHKMVVTDFSDKPETFLNINTPDDMAGIEKKLHEIK